MPPRASILLPLANTGGYRAKRRRRIEQASSRRRGRRERPASPDRSPVRSSAMITAVVKTAFAAP